MAVSNHGWVTWLERFYNLRRAPHLRSYLHHPGCRLRTGPERLAGSYARVQTEAEATQSPLPANPQVTPYAGPRA